jgi:xanthine dehydrogenase accessory factor
MMELRKIVELWREQVDERGRSVLVTLVAVEGSSYRLPGARLLLTANGRVAGTISGGCLEADVVRRALWLTRDGAAVERYTMAFDDTAEIPFGLGCGGTIDLLFEPLNSPEGAALLEAMAASLDSQAAKVVHYLPGDGRGLRRLILGGDGQVVFASAGLSAEKIACGRELELGKIYAGRFVERLTPPQRLVIFGAGDDARPLSEMGAGMGWKVVVADGRTHLARAERFPAAHTVVLLNSGEDLPLHADDAVVLMTHSYEQDRQLLEKVLTASPRYLGLLGSRHRSSLLVMEAAEALGRSVEECCARVYAPVGLDLGGDGPEAIALSIVSEIQAVCHGREGKIARLNANEIARQIEQGGAERYRQPQCALNASE